MKRQAGKGSSLGLGSVLVATLVAASLLGIAANHLALSVLGQDDVAELPAMDEESPDDLAIEGVLEMLDEGMGSEIGEFVANEITKTKRGVPVADAAKDALLAYESQGTCLLCEAGYLDLSRDAWACVVQGDGWVEVRVVRALGDGDQSEVTVVHMDAKPWTREVEELVREET